MEAQDCLEALPQSMQRNKEANREKRLHYPR